jgi:ABC-type transport system involved in multi-copper enzyme maturation permease subunit
MIEEHHACSGAFSKKIREKTKLILMIVQRDLRQMHRHGLPVLLFLSVLLLFLGILLFNMAKGTLDEIGMPTWTGRIAVEGNGGGEGLLTSLTLLHVVYGYSVLVTMILVPVAFSTAYNHEIKKGTVRILSCYPIGVFEITIAKLIYAALVGFIFAAPVSLLPVLGLGKPGGDLLTIFVIAYGFSLSIVVVAAFVANSITFAAKKMYIQPGLLANLFVVFSFFTTSTLLKGLTAVLGFATPLFQAAGQLTPLSPYHQGHLLLSSVLGGPDLPTWWVFLVPLALLILGIFLSLRLWPDIYERE